MSADPAKENQQHSGPLPDNTKVEDQTFHPTCVLYITPHNSLTRRIKIYFFSRSLSVSDTQSINDLLSSAAKQGAKIDKAGTEEPVYTVVQGGLWSNAKAYEGKFVNKKESKDNLIADWNRSFVLHSANTFMFLKSISNDKDGRGKKDKIRHPLALKRTTVISSRSEAFVKDSV